VIPDSLRIHPTDTEEERLRKQKRVRSLKQAFRQRKLEAQAAAVASSWQSFKAGAGGGGVKRASAAAPSSEAAEGAGTGKRARE
jgi:hypothetical protein